MKQNQQMPAASLKSNQEVVAEIMRFSNHGALAEVFVMEALSRYANAVANADPDSLGFGESLALPPAWRSVAREIADKLENHLRT